MNATLKTLTAAAIGAMLFAGTASFAQTTPPPPPTDQGGPQQDNSPVILKKKSQQNPQDEPPPPAEEQEKVKNPKGLENYSIRVDVPVVTVDVSVQLQKTGQFVPGLKGGNFKVTEDGVEQRVTDVRMQQKPITAVLLLEFAANSWAFIQDMQQSSYVFFRQLRPEDYIAVITYDLRTRILTDFTQDKGITEQALRSLTIPGFSDTNEFDALYETLDRVSRIEGRKYIILISSGRDTFSKLNLDQIYKKVKQSQDVTIYTISTGGLARELTDARGGMGGMQRMNYLQADNQMRTFSSMTGGQSYFPLFQGALPEIFNSINASIRNQYVLSYRPTNTSQDGTYRKIKVELVDREGLPLKMIDEKGKQVKYSVMARDGYRARMPVE
ncbi:von Willebrand factor type A-like protein [Terriglobus roseus DSM 18391]|uniref:von Willebrand factor type A-like protein n=1 Tax=Terriglobus roseus (strain DSM 18391 / NRRL B-41598 / KBS 63) TaxID=926566 RepID=I3ZFC3_TERRK|nr:VWA domain-containing protein [Terriglobus roseus]AFL87941.1 von Willebrand factor type A-like protein [Terriglobus roseus DSM 18391]